jgi:hydrogenase nickel incorporation protein HypA/HybF
MHELSIATALFEQVKRHTPPGAQVLKARVLIGPMQGIEPDSLRFGWEAVWREDGENVPELVLDLPQWKLKCNECGREWESPELYVACECGSALASPIGGGELQLVSIEVTDLESVGESK